MDNEEADDQSSITDEVVEEARVTWPAPEADSDYPSGSDRSSPDDDRDQLLAQIAKDTATTKTLVAVLLAVLIIVAAIIGVLVRIDKNDTKTASTPTTAARAAATTTTAAPVESVAGKPCVATVDPLPAGAPPVDVVVGPAPTTLVVKDLKEGTGAAATATSTVTVNYIGVACSTGKIFDSSYKTGTPTPATFPLSQVIPGFTTGITGMKVGGQRLLGIPSDQAYGAQGRPPVIAGDEALWFVVEVTAITGS
jgi:peptidylprolyl isomerase